MVLSRCKGSHDGFLWLVSLQKPAIMAGLCEWNLWAQNCCASCEIYSEKLPNTIVAKHRDQNPRMKCVKSWHPVGKFKTRWSRIHRNPATWYLKNKCRRQSGKGTVVAHIKQVHLCMELSRDAQTLKFSLEASVGTAGIPIQQVHLCSMYRDSYGRCSRTSRPLTRVLTQSDVSDVFRRCVSGSLHRCLFVCHHETKHRARIHCPISISWTLPASWNLGPLKNAKHYVAWMHGNIILNCRSSFACVNDLHS